jgi:hypothetical protein
MKIVTINNKHYNLDAIVRIQDRQVFFNDGKSEIFTEPEIQELFSFLFNEPRIEAVTVVEEPLVIKKKVVKKK